jgi:hypothetical protein
VDEGHGARATRRRLGGTGRPGRSGTAAGRTAGHDHMSVGHRVARWPETRPKSCRRAVRVQARARTAHGTRHQETCTHARPSSNLRSQQRAEPVSGERVRSEEKFAQRDRHDTRARDGRGVRARGAGRGCGDATDGRDVHVRAAGPARGRPGLPILYHELMSARPLRHCHRPPPAQI